jgi:hypothetical protein
MAIVKEKKDVFMKRTVAAVLCGLLAVVATSLAFAAAGNVAYTVHNMSKDEPTGGVMGRYIKSSGEDQICVFCHTPHNAQPNRPLWNKVMPTQAFNMYTSSATLSSAARLATAPSAESLLCLSCHDGRTAINVLHNTANPTAQLAGTDKVVDIDGTYDDADTPGGVGIALGLYAGLDGGKYGPAIGKTSTDYYYGGNLTNDHPISFSYKDAQAEKPAQLNEVVDARIRFYGGAAKRIECGSCHDPHVNYGADRMGGTWTEGGAQPELKPFLRMGNVGSALCFACHNK